MSVVQASRAGNSPYCLPLAADTEQACPESHAHYHHVTIIKFVLALRKLG